MLAKSKLNSIKTLTSQALIDMEISHQKFITILKEDDESYEKMKVNSRNIKEELDEKTQNTRLNSVNSRTLKNVFFCFCIYKNEQNWQRSI